MGNLKQKLIQLEEYLFNPKVRASYRELNNLIADDFTEIGASGIRFDKKQALERLPHEHAPRIKAGDFELRILSPTCAQLLYKAIMIKHEETTPIYSLRSSIWSLNNGQWQMSFHQGTPCETFEL